VTRLFVALHLPLEAAEELEDIAFDVPGAIWTPADQYHLTLRFIGDPSPRSLGDVDRALRSGARESPARAATSTPTSRWRG
jgi:2'-5' RNA ligase